MDIQGAMYAVNFDHRPKLYELQKRFDTEIEFPPSNTDTTPKFGKIWISGTNIENIIQCYGEFEVIQRQVWLQCN